MQRTGLWSSLGLTVALILALLMPSRTVAQRSVQSPQCKGIIRGTASDSEGQLVREIMVVAWPLGVNLGVILPRVRTDQAGKYRFEQLCPGRYTVLAEDEKAGYPRSSPDLFEFLYGRRVAEVKLTAKQLQAELRVQLPAKPARMHIHMTDRATNVEITKFTIEMIVPGQHRSPEIKYEFSPDIDDREIEVPPDKDFILHVTADGFHEWSESVGGGKLVHLRAGTQTSLEAQLETVK